MIRRASTQELPRLVRRYRSLVAAALLTILGLGSQDSPVAVELWNSAGDLDVHVFASVSGMAEVGPGIVWVSDARLDTVIEVRGAAEEFRIVARPGQGPGEVDGPTYISVNASGQIAILNLAGRSVERFASDRRFEERVHLPFTPTNPKGFLLLDDGRFVISGGAPGREGIVHLFSADGEHVRSWGQVPATSNPRAGVMVAGGAVANGWNGEMLFSRAAPHEILRIPLEGDATVEVASDAELLDAIGDDFIEVRGAGPSFVRSFKWLFPKSLFIHRLGAFLLINVVAFHEEGYTLWELYGSDGKQLARERVDRAYQVWSYCGDNEFLVSYLDPVSEEWTIGRLSISLPGTTA